MALSMLTNAVKQVGQQVEGSTMVSNLDFFDGKLESI